MTLKNTENTNAVFTIINNQKIDEQENVLKVETEGWFYLRNNAYFLLYKEYTELGEVSVLVRAKNDFVSIRRNGACSARMEYEKGARREVLYRVPYGNMVIDLETQDVKNLLGADGGRIELKYSLTINHEVYYNDMRVEVKVNAD